MTQYLNEAELHSDWTRGHINDPAAGAAEVRRALADQGVRVNLGLYTGLLAQLEAATLRADRALARIDKAFRLSQQVGHGWSLPFLHRLRGEIVLERDPPDRATAKDAFRAAIAVARRQDARSLALLAALALARLCQSTGRAAEARAVLRTLWTITESRGVVVRRDGLGVGDSGMRRRGVVRSHDRRGGDSATMGEGRRAA